MKLSTCAVAASLCACPIAASAQAPTEQSATLATPATAAILSNPAENVLRTGMQIPLRTSEPLTTKEKKLRVGQRVQMEVAESIMLNGQTIIPAGSPAVGEITDVRNKGMWGKSGRINARVLYARVNGRQIRLTGQFDDKGVTGTAGVVAAVALIPIAGFFTTGTSAQIPAGSAVIAFLDEDLIVAPPPPPAPVAAVTPVAVMPATPVSAQQQ